MPALTLEATRCARPMSRVRIAAAKPNGESLASRNASASSLNRRHGRERPEYFFLKDTHVGFRTSANTVGFDEDSRPHRAIGHFCGHAASDQAARHPRGRSARSSARGRAAALKSPGRVASPDRRDRRCGWISVLALQLLHELVVDRGLHQMARRTDAGLTGADERAERGIVDRADRRRNPRTPSPASCRQAPWSGAQTPWRRRSPAIRPASVPPVSTSLLISPMLGQASCRRFGPRPSTTLNTPGGKPASVKICASFSVVSGVYSDGLTTVTQPDANTAASDLHMIIKRMIERRAVGDDADRRSQRIVQIRSPSTGMTAIAPCQRHDRRSSERNPAAAPVAHGSR